MTLVDKRHLKTGGDPRTLPDYASLRDELNKLTHPARPDVNWQLVEQHSLNLFDNNGIELQTAAWYTLARTHLNGVTGLSEGLAIIDALITWQWASVWPSSAHARIEILSSMSKRLQQTFRMLPLQRADQRTLFNAEKLLSGIENSLQRLELRHASGLEALRIMVRNAGVRLENGELTASSVGEVLTGTHEHDPSGTPQHEPDSRWIFVANQPRPAIEIDIQNETPRGLSPTVAFTCGFAAAAACALLALWIVPKWLNPPEQKELMATVAPLPAVMSVTGIEQLRKADPDWLRKDAGYSESLNKQLESLGKLPPGWSLQYGHQLIEQTRALYPESALASETERKWRSILSANALPAGDANGWHEGARQLQQLQDQLNGLDEKKGRYMTVSELKTAVFTISKSFNSSIPAEELVRQIQGTPPGQPVSPALLTQTELKLQQLTNSLELSKLNVNNKLASEQ